MSKKQKVLVVGAAFFAALLLFSSIMVCREIKDSNHNLVKDNIFNIFMSIRELLCVVLHKPV